MEHPQINAYYRREESIKETKSATKNIFRKIFFSF